MWHRYIQANSVEQVLGVLSQEGPQARIVAGATDLILELERGVRTGIQTLIDVTRIPGLDQIHEDEDGLIHVGPLVTHNQCVASELIRRSAYPLARAAWEVGAPQIRNRGTVAGNLITASPANDTITPLVALGASVTLGSSRGQRKIALSNFYLGVRRTVMAADEMLIEISFPALTRLQRGTFLKLALRRAQAIALMNVAVVLSLKRAVVGEARIALGAVAPTILRASAAEAFLAGRKLTDSVISRAAELAEDASHPIDDVRGTAAYRREMVKVITARGLRGLTDGTARDGFPDHPVLLWGARPADRISPPRDRPNATGHTSGLATIEQPTQAIETSINGHSFTFTSGHDKTLLRLLREEADLTGTKEGCAEGECGACTVFLDGKAVMACLVPAPRAHKADVVTIEGLAQGNRLHPVQQAFVEDAAVQCGYCTPGFIMSAAKLLEERPRPSRHEIEQAITGNLCRCTGYYKITRAIEDASLAVA